MKQIIRLLFAFLSFTAYAEKASLLFFGGYNTDTDQINTWENGAKANPEVTKQYSIRGIAYPSKKSNYESAVTDGKDQIEKLVSEINSSPTKEFVLAGHSSGSALAIEIAKKIKNTRRLKLIVLDGFIPPPDLRSRITTQCWSAAAGEEENIRALNYNGMQTCESHYVYRPYKCGTPMCLHFSLVNSNAKKEVVDKANFKESGYKDFSPNLLWLNNFLSPNIKSDSSSIGSK